MEGLGNALASVPHWAQVAFAIAVFLGVSYAAYRARAALLVFYDGASQVVRWLIVALNWAGPGIFAATFYLIPSLRTVVSWNMADSTWKAIAIAGGIGVLWLVLLQMMTANNPAQKLLDLKLDFGAAMIWVVVFAIWLGTQVHASGVEVWLAIVFGLCLADAVIGTILGFTNAYQKNPSEIRNVSGKA